MIEFSEILAKLKTLPLGWRIVAIVSVAVFVIAMLSSCANTKAVVRASSENTTASVSITTNNPTSVTVTNRQDTVGLNFNPNNR